MTYREYQEQVATKQYNYLDYYDAITRGSSSTVHYINNHAAELYARSKWDEACVEQLKCTKQLLATVPNGLEYPNIHLSPKPEFKP